ncbi:hypothetical protein D3C85_1513860 [compost metagenome]
MDGETGRVHLGRAGLQLVPLDVDGDQVGGRDFLRAQAVLVDQEGGGFSGQAHGNVREDLVAPAIEIQQPVGGGQVGAQLLFCGVHRVSRRHVL